MNAPGTLRSARLAQTSESTEWNAAFAMRIALYFVAIALLAIGWRGSFPLDDAYITMHNARAVMQGWDATYGVPPLIGATSLAHLALMVALGAVMPLPYAAMTICLAGAAAYAVGLDLLIRRAGASGWKIPALTLCGLLCGSLPTLLANGLETSLACAAVTWLLLLDRRLPLLAGAAPFVRPELAILSALSLAQSVRNASAARRSSAIAIAILVSLPFLSWSYFETGHLLPSTMAAKLAFFREGNWPMSDRVAVFSRAIYSSGFIVLIPGLAGLRDWRAWAFLASVILFLVAVLPGAFTWNDARYLGPLVPVFILGFAQASRTSAMSCFIILLALSVAVTAPRRIADLNRSRTWNEAQAAALHASLAPLRPGSRILVHDAGIPAWVAPRMHLIDVVGLKTPSSIEAHENMTVAACNWGKAIDRIARTNRAQNALVLEAPFWRCVKSNLEDEGWTFTMLPSESEYRLYAITPPHRRDLR